MGLNTRDISQAALFTALIAAGAFITIPLGPVPFTLQPLFVILASLVLGARLGAVSVGAYLVLGLIAPVYAGGTSGLGVLLGPTGGYLIGFLAGAALAGAIAQQGRPTVIRYTLAGCVALVPIYVLGAAWLGISLDITLASALAAGVLPFLPFDLIKAVAAAWAALALVRSPLALPAVMRDR